jgi:hypothetical protein
LLKRTCLYPQCDSKPHGAAGITNDGFKDRRKSSGGWTALTDWKKLQGLGYHSGNEFMNKAAD